jgi:hypothetical protein
MLHPSVRAEGAHAGSELWVQASARAGCHQTAFKDLQFSAPPSSPVLERERESESEKETPAQGQPTLFSDGKRWG